MVLGNPGLQRYVAEDPTLERLRSSHISPLGLPSKVPFDEEFFSSLLGSLLKIDAAVNEALADCEELLTRPEQAQGDFFSEDWRDRRISIDVEEAKSTLLSRLELFLHAHSHGDDLGLKLKGEQLAAGVRFARLAHEGAYDLVVANPPYQATSKMADSKYIEKRYPLGKADLYAAFLLRGLQLVRDGGVSAMLTMRNWMFIKQYAGAREWLLAQFDLRALGDFAIGAFDEVPNDVLSVVVSVFCRREPVEASGVAVQPSPPDDRSYDRGRTQRKRASTLCHVGRHEFDQSSLAKVEGSPFVYWWTVEDIRSYQSTVKLGEQSNVKKGITTGDNSRFLRSAWEVRTEISRIPQWDCPEQFVKHGWSRAILGGKGREWMDDSRTLIRWAYNGAEIALHPGGRYGRGATEYYKRGVAISVTGNTFSARLHMAPSVITDSGVSVYPASPEKALLQMNRDRARRVLEALNPTISFKVNDVERLPLEPISGSSDIFSSLADAFADRARSAEWHGDFCKPGPSPWRYAQDWAQLAVDRSGGEPLPTYEPEYDPEPPTDHLSFAIGVGLGRFCAGAEGILDPGKDDLSAALPTGICFLDGSLEKRASGDSLGHSATKLLHAKWIEHGPAVDPDTDLRSWLRLKFFGDVHKGMYENRPIYFPLSSERKTFVAYVSIHRWTEDTLRALLAEHLHPALTRLEGEIADLRESRQSADKKIAREAERRYDQVAKWKHELDDFIERVEQCAEKGPLPPDAKTPKREVDARHAPDLDDGVMINSAALWPLLEPQWKDPKKWWKELASAKGKKDFDWAHLAARYFPSRVDKKCQEDPSLGVAHGCFWKYHPESAYRWELRLQDEIGPDFTLDEEGSDAFRAAFERDHPDKVEELVAAEQKRRDRKKKQEAKEPGSAGPLVDWSEQQAAKGAAG